MALQDLPGPFIVHPAESGRSGTVLACVRFPSSRWAQFGSQHSIEAVPQSQLAEGRVALEGEKRRRLACAGVPPCHRAVLSMFQLLVVTWLKIATITVHYTNTVNFSKYLVVCLCKAQIPVMHLNEIKAEA